MEILTFPIVWLDLNSLPIIAVLSGVVTVLFLFNELSSLFIDESYLLYLERETLEPEIRGIELLVPSLEVLLNFLRHIVELETNVVEGFWIFDCTLGTAVMLFDLALKVPSFDREDKLTFFFDFVLSLFSLDL